MIRAATIACVLATADAFTAPIGVRGGARAPVAPRMSLGPEVASTIASLPTTDLLAKADPLELFFINLPLIFPSALVATGIAIQLTDDANPGREYNPREEVAVTVPSLPAVDLPALPLPPAYLGLGFAFLTYLLVFVGVDVAAPVNFASGVLAKGLMDGWNLFANVLLPGAVLKY